MIINWQSLYHNGFYRISSGYEMNGIAIITATSSSTVPGLFFANG